MLILNTVAEEKLEQFEAHTLDKADPDVRRIEELDKAVRRDAHKMHAFVRFREVRTNRIITSCGRRRAFSCAAFRT